MSISNSNKDKLKYPIKVLHFLGFLLNEKNVLQKFFLYVFEIALLITTLQVIILAKILEGSFENFVAILDSTVAILAFIGNFYPLLFYKDTINGILRKRQLFWSYSDMDEKACKRNDKLLDFIDFQIKALSYSNWILVVQLVINMFLTGKPQYSAFTFNNASLYFTFCQQTFLFIYLAPIMYSMRYIYGILFTELTIQYRLLNESFQNMRNLADIRKNVEHNVLLLSVIADMNKVFSFLVMQSYVCTVLPATSQVIIALSTDSLNTQLNCLGYCVAVIGQFGFLCFPPSWLKEESMKTSSAIFESNWYDGEKNDLRGNIPFLIINCQKIVTLSGGGMFVADRTTFVQVLRLTYQTITLLLQTMNK